jgi:hypothetical protein
MTFFKRLVSSLVLCLLYPLNIHAEILPSRCEVTGCGCEITGFGYNNLYLVLNKTGKQAFYLIHNKSKRPIELERLKNPEAFMSPPLRAKISPNKWAAFASDVESLPFQCSFIMQETTQQTDCFQVLDVCQYPRAKFALSNMGNYWVSTDQTKVQVIKDAAAKGIYLHW